MASVILAVASIECFLNDLVAHIRLMPNPSPGLVGLPEIWDEMERARIQLKVLVLAGLLGKPLLKERQPFQDFDLLVAVRNELVHAKPMTIRGHYRDGKPIIEQPRIVKRLLARKLIQKQPEAASLEARVSNPAIAAWACNTCVEIIDYVANALPQGVERSLVTSFALNTFRKV
jgi:hypothetical protein